MRQNSVKIQNLEIGDPRALRKGPALEKAHTNQHFVLLFLAYVDRFQYLSPSLYYYKYL